MSPRCLYNPYPVSLLAVGSCMYVCLFVYVYDVYSFAVVRTVEKSMAERQKSQQYKF